MGKNKLTREEIEAIPKDKRTLEEWELLADYKTLNLTAEESDFNDKFSKQLGDAIEKSLENLKENYTEAQSMSRKELFVFWQNKITEIIEKEQSLKEREKSLKEREEKLKEPGSYRKSRHLVEALNQRKALEGTSRIDFKSEIKNTIDLGVKVPSIIGINLTRGERKLTNCFSIMLQQRSNTYDDKEKDYYSGDNKNPITKSYGTKVTAPKPELKFTHFELTKTYTNKEQPSGKDMQIVKNILDGLVYKTFLIERNVVYRNDKTGEDIPYMFRRHEPLIMIGERVDKSDQSRDKSQDIIVALNPLFVLQIRNFYVTYPIDIDQRIEEAYGSKRVPEAVYIFIDYLASLRGVAHNYTHEIYKSTLHQKLNEKWLQESRLTKLEEITSKAIEVAKKIELLENWKEVDGATGERKYIFKTKKEWIKEN